MFAWQSEISEGSSWKRKPNEAQQKGRTLARWPSIQRADSQQRPVAKGNNKDIFRWWWWWSGEEDLPVVSEFSILPPSPPSAFS